MALSPTQTAMANQLVQKFSTISGPVDAAKGGVKSLTRTLTTELSTTTFSSLPSIESEMDSLFTQVDDLLPGTDLSAMTDLKNFIDNCPFFGASANPISSIYGTRDGIFDKVDDLITNSGSTYPEFTLANIADSINKLLSGSGFPGGNVISDLLASADSLIDCLSGIPGYEPDVIAFGNEISSLYSEMNIISDPLSASYGQLDYSTIYSNAGISASGIANMQYTIGRITTLKSNALSSISSSANAAKNYLGTGGLF